MPGSGLLKKAGYLLIAAGVLDIVLGVLMQVLPIAVRPGFLNVGLWAWIFFIVLGICALVCGVLALLWRNTPNTAPALKSTAFGLMVITFAVFFLSYGQQWAYVLMDLANVIASIVFYIGARKNARASRLN